MGRRGRLAAMAPDCRSGTHAVNTGGSNPPLAMQLIVSDVPRWRIDEKNNPRSAIALGGILILIPQTTPFGFKCAREELNLDLILRRDASYPLNYGRVFLVLGSVELRGRESKYFLSSLRSLS